MKNPLTLCLVVQDGKILLGMKKRGFGMGRWNGFGGKVEEGESIGDAARRETREECGVTIETMEKVGIHEFRFENDPGEILEVHVFRAGNFAGEPRETEEMMPRWFDFDDIPYDEMWADDRYWIPLFLAGKKFRTKFLFGSDDRILEHNILIVEKV
jgi:8-oxo-dGTP diphosphatase/2-hydroxy-dATP diphosphatase